MGVRSVKLELIVANETFLVDERTKEVFAEGEREEVACPSDTRAAGTPNMFGCQGAMATYAWHGPTRPFCPLHFVNSMVGEVAKKEGKIVFSSPQAMARFEISHAGQVEHECLRAWYRTSVDNVWASMTDLEPRHGLWAGEHNLALLLGDLAHHAVDEVQWAKWACRPMPGVRGHRALAPEHVGGPCCARVAGAGDFLPLALREHFLGALIHQEGLVGDDQLQLDGPHHSVNALP